MFDVTVQISPSWRRARGKNACTHPRVMERNGAFPFNQPRKYGLLTLQREASAVALLLATEPRESLGHKGHKVPRRKRRRRRPEDAGSARDFRGESVVFALTGLNAATCRNLPSPPPFDCTNSSAARVLARVITLRRLIIPATTLYPRYVLALAERSASAVPALSRLSVDGRNMSGRADVRDLL